MARYSMEQMFEIWDDDSGSRLEVGPDRDSLGLIEIRHVNENDKVGDRIAMDHQQARLLIDALTKLLPPEETDPR